MRTINWVVNTGFVGLCHSGTFEVEDDTPNSEITKMVDDERDQAIETYWGEGK